MAADRERGRRFERLVKRTSFLKGIKKLKKRNLVKSTWL
jgi:hypothetical protein